jgi:hypothetical protein
MAGTAITKTRDPDLIKKLDAVAGRVLKGQTS